MDKMHKKPVMGSHLSAAEAISAYEKGIQDALLAIIKERCDDLIAEYPNGPGLWKSLERTATAVLKDAKDRNLILQYRVRCDAETASWGTPTAPVVEILLKFPRRVQQIQLSMGNMR